MHGPIRNVRPDLRGPDGAATVDPSKAKVGTNYDPTVARGVTPAASTEGARTTDDGILILDEVPEGYSVSHVRITITLPLPPGTSEADAQDGGKSLIHALRTILLAGGFEDGLLDARLGYTDDLADLRALPETPEVTP